MQNAEGKTQDICHDLRARRTERPFYVAVQIRRRPSAESWRDWFDWPTGTDLGPTRHAEPTGCPTAAGSRVLRADSTAGRAWPEYPRGSERDGRYELRRNRSRVSWPSNASSTLCSTKRSEFVPRKSRVIRCRARERKRGREQERLMPHCTRKERDFVLVLLIFYRYRPARYNKSRTVGLVRCNVSSPRFIFAFGLLIFYVILHIWGTNLFFDHIRYARALKIFCPTFCPFFCPLLFYCCIINKIYVWSFNNINWNIILH